MHVDTHSIHQHVVCYSIYTTVYIGSLSDLCRCLIMQLFGIADVIACIMGDVSKKQNYYKHDLLRFPFHPDI